VIKTLFKSAMIKSRGFIYTNLFNRYTEVGRNVCFEGRSLAEKNGGGKIIIGDNCMIREGVILNAYGGIIRLEDNVSLSYGVVITSRGSVRLGSNVLIGEYTSIRDCDHRFDDINKPVRKQGYTTKPVLIEDDVWIGRGCSINKGVTIGKGAVIGANSVVTRSIPPYAVAVGSPARVIKYRWKSANVDVEEEVYSPYMINWNKVKKEGSLTEGALVNG